MEARQCDELELITHLPKLLLECRDRLDIKLLAPVKRGGAVVDQHFAGEAFMNGIGEALGLFETWLSSFTPDQITVWSVGESPGDGCIQPASHSEEALVCPFPSKKILVGWVNVTGD